jgi:membrane protease YdiL (CAAX protease family)
MALHEHAIRLSSRGMRVIRFPLVRLVIAISILMVSNTSAFYISEGILRLINTEPFPFFDEGLKTFFLCSFSVIFYWVYVSLFEGRPMNELSYDSLVSQTAFGLFLGLAFISIIMLIISLMGSFKVSGLNPARLIAPIILMAIQAGILEEILTRGVLFRIVEDGLGTWLSVLISAFVFGFLHIWNQNATIFSSFSIAITAGVILALFYVLTRKLWVPIGIHIAWNFTLGGIYNAPVSGNQPRGLLDSELTGHKLITGGDFGPEASIVTIIFFLLIGAYLTWLVIKRKAYKKPMWIKG